MIRYLKDYKLAKRQKIRKGMKALKENLESINEKYEELFINPNQDLIKEIEDVLNGNTTIEHFEKVSDRNKAYYVEVQKLFKAVKNGK